MKLHIAMTSAAAVAAAIPPPQPVPLRSPSPPSGGETASSGEVTKMRTELAAKNRSLREARDKIKELTESNDKIKKTLEDDQRNREFRFNAVNRNLKEVCIDLGVIFKILKVNSLLANKEKKKNFFFLFKQMFICLFVYFISYLTSQTQTSPRRPR